MRPGLAAGLVVLIILTVALPVQGAPLPETRGAAREAIHHSLADVDSTSAGALHEARALVTGIRGLGVVKNDAIDVRASLMQPAVRGSGDILSMVWITAQKDTKWSGAYWIETQNGASSPNYLEVQGEGVLLFVDEDAHHVGDDVAITYHFLGIDGKHVMHDAGRAALLDFLPDPGRADFGGGVASRGERDLELIFLSPWNLLRRNATLGITLASDTGTLDEVLLAGCADPNANVVEAGCRQMYPFLRPDGFASATLWHLDEDGARVIDRSLTRAQLEAGYTFSE